LSICSCALPLKKGNNSEKEPDIGGTLGCSTSSSTTPAEYKRLAEEEDEFWDGVNRPSWCAFTPSETSSIDIFDRNWAKKTRNPDDLTSEDQWMKFDKFRYQLQPRQVCRTVLRTPQGKYVMSDWQWWTITQAIPTLERFEKPEPRSTPFIDMTTCVLSLQWSWLKPKFGLNHFVPSQEATEDFERQEWNKKEVLNFDPPLVQTPDGLRPVRLGPSPSTGGEDIDALIDELVEDLQATPVSQDAGKIDIESPEAKIMQQGLGQLPSAAKVPVPNPVPIALIQDIVPEDDRKVDDALLHSLLLEAMAGARDKMMILSLKHRARQWISTNRPDWSTKKQYYQTAIAITAVFADSSALDLMSPILSPASWNRLIQSHSYSTGVVRSSWWTNFKSWLRPFMPGQLALPTD
jgi:hypothetical protein